jgi:methyltransferase (TIGR00027 family)
MQRKADTPGHSINPISMTARWTAAARAMETERHDKLFVDALARPLAGREGFDLLKWHEGGGVVPFLAIRTRFLDDAIVRITAERGIRQVVVVAAGLDTRAFRLPWSPDTTVYELDRPELLAEKARILTTLEAIPRCRRISVGVDLTKDWNTLLLEAGYRVEEPTVWLVEGVLFYFTEGTARKLLSTAASLASAGSWLLADLMSRELLVSPWTQRYLGTLAEAGTAWQFGTDAPEQFISNCGWEPQEIKEPGEEGADFERWPYLVMPREVPGVPRSFLVTAAKCGAPPDSSRR